jgi:YtcA-like protein
MRSGNIESRGVRLHNPARTISPAMRFLLATTRRFAIPTAAAFLLGGCDPVVNIAGANFPAWLFSALCGAILAVAIRPIFVMTRVEKYLWPLPVVYSSLAILMGCIVWLIFFNRI